jgi:hypothetical protein
MIETNTNLTDESGRNINPVLANVNYEFYYDDSELQIINIKYQGVIQKGDYIDIDDGDGGEENYQVDFITHKFDVNGNYLKTRVSLEVY